jgi:hypothetical protein
MRLINTKPVHRPPTGEPEERFLLDSVQPFYPAVLAPVVTMTTIQTVPWLGMIVAVLLLAMIRHWWTCIFGLLVASIVIACCAGSLFFSFRLWHWL